VSLPLPPVHVPRSAEAALRALYRRAWLFARLSLERALDRGVTSRVELRRAIVAELKGLRLRALVLALGRRIGEALRRQVQLATGRRLEPRSAAVEELVSGWADEVVRSITRSLTGRALRLDATGQARRTLLSAAVAALRSGADAAAEVARMTRSALRRMAASATAAALDLGSRANRSIQVAVGVSYYIWRTQGDDRVRDRHRAREGAVFRWADPPEGGQPGTEYNCRCVAVPLA